MAMKKEIIEKHKHGATFTHLCSMYGKPKSTIFSILKDKEKFMEAKVSKSINKLVKTRNSNTEEMEEVVMVLIKERERADDSL